MFYFEKVATRLPIRHETATIAELLFADIGMFMFDRASFDLLANRARQTNMAGITDRRASRILACAYQVDRLRTFGHCPFQRSKCGTLV